MPYCRINDCNYYYELHGHGSTLVLIAGYSCDLSFWTPMLQELANEFNVLVFDNRAVGQTQDNGTHFSLEQMADETVQLIQALKLPSPTIVGQSMGGMIAQLIAIKYPQLVKNLIALNCASAISVRSLLALASFIKLLKQNVSLETVVEASLPWFYSSQFLENTRNMNTIKQAILNHPHPQSVSDLERQFTALSTFTSVKSASTIKMPTQIIAAKNDIICQPDESKALADSIPHAKFVTLEGGHSSPIEVPKNVCEMIFKFLVD